MKKKFTTFVNHVLSLNIDRGWRRSAIRLLRWHQDGAVSAGRYMDLRAWTVEPLGAHVVVRELGAPYRGPQKVRRHRLAAVVRFASA